MLYHIITIAAIFKKVEWKQIEHRSITLKEIRMIKAKIYIILHSFVKLAYLC